MQMITQGDTQTLIKANTCNKTGDLDIFSFRLSRRKPGFNSPWDYQINQLFINLQFFHLLSVCTFVCPFRLKASTKQINHFFVLTITAPSENSAGCWAFPGETSLILMLLVLMPISRGLVFTA